MKPLPKITIAIVSFNNADILPRCLDAIKNQDYPKGLIEYLNVDGGSTDGTKELMESYDFRVLKSPIPRNAEAQRAHALAEASHNLIAYIDTDNVMPTDQWLRQMVEPFQNDDDIICSQTLHYTYQKEESLFNRYCALFGVSDPVVYYVGRPDRLPQFKQTWTLGDEVEDKGNYYKVKFSEENLPTVGCNGIVLKRDVLLAHAEVAPERFLHIDIFVDLLRKGYGTFAIVKNDVLHLTALTLGKLMKKRVAFLSYYFGQTAPRRYKIFDPSKRKDQWKLILFIIYTVTLVKPLWDAIRGFIRVRDMAWFVHPYVCWIYLYAYGMSTVKNALRRRTNKI